MRLKTALEIAEDCALETVGEAVYNIKIHSINLFNYSDINKELAELYDELSYCETLNITENTNILDGLAILNSSTYELNYSVMKEKSVRNKKIVDDFSYRVNNKKHTAYDFVWESFEQLWGNTSGGLETIGGSAMTTQTTDVFLPKDLEDEDCHVYFNGIYGYSVPMSETFMNDVENHNVKGCLHYKQAYIL